MITCAACGKDNPEGFAFCGFCTTPLEAQPSAGEERKIVSVLFCDLVGFTSASETADPEEVRARLVPYHARVRDEIEHFGGVVEKFVGDAVMAVFGAPIAREDDAERAVRASLRILEAIEEMNEVDPSLGLAVRIAINTGEVLVALGARPELGEAMIAGDVVNTASRLQGAAPVSSVVVAEGTHRATEPIFVWEELPPVELKGKAEPTPLWQAVEARGRFGVDIMRAPTTPFVGREHDLELLRTLYDRALKERTVQFVTLVGEPGVGKSRLIAELGQDLDRRPELISWRQGRCLPYGEGISFWALGEIVKAHAGILDSDPMEVAKEKLASVLSPLGEEAPWMAQRLAPLLGADATSSAEREETFTAWRKFLESIASDGPAVLVIEDLHWADAPMIEFLDHVAAWSDGVPILVLASARPEFFERYPDWGAGTRNALTLSLSPLTDSDTARLVGSLLETVVLPAETQAAILDRAGGNPLYAEEFVRMLTDRGLLVREGPTMTLLPGADIPVPDTVQALIAARIDTLPADRKALLHDASVLGKVFWSGAVEDMASRDRADVRRALHELAAKELVRPARTSSIAGQEEFAFWHALVRDVAYSQMPRSTRAAKHLAAATWIQGASGDRFKDVAEILVHHYDEAIAFGLDAQQVRSQLAKALASAGERAKWTDIPRERVLLERALDLTDDGGSRARIARQLGRCVAHLGDLSAAIDYVRASIDLALASGDRVQEGSGLVELGGLFAATGDIDKGHEHYARGLEILDEAGPTIELMRARLAWADELWIAGDLEGAIQAADAAIELRSQVDEADLDELTRVAAGSAIMRGVCRALLGDETGLTEARSGVDDLKSLGHISAGDLVTISEGEYPAFGPNRVLATLDEAEGLAKQAGDMHGRAWCTIAKALPLMDLGEWDAAIDAIDRSIDRARRGHIKPLLTLAAAWRVELALMLAETEDFSPLLPVILDGQSSAESQVRTACNAVSALRATGLGQRAEAAAAIRALAADTDLRADWYYVRLLPLLTRICVELEDLDLGRSLSQGVRPAPIGHEHALVTCDAILAEAEGRWEEAAEGYADAERRWAEFPSVLERGHALFGRGRCLLQLGLPEATASLVEARDVFASLRARPLTEQVDALIATATAQSS